MHKLKQNETKAWFRGAVSYPARKRIQVPIYVLEPGQCDGANLLAFEWRQRSNKLTLCEKCKIVNLLQNQAYEATHSPSTAEFIYLFWIACI